MKRSEILNVVETDQGLYLLFIDYPEEDIASAIGHVYKTSGQRGAGVEPEQVLATNDTLRVMWASPSGALWVGSADGNVGTNAPVQWPSAGNGVDYLRLGSSPAWSVTALPRQAADGLRPNITAMWGTDDTNVFAATYDGNIYHWDGKVWQQNYDGAAYGNRTINVFGGSGPADVFAGGVQGTLLHFNGAAWSPRQIPGAPNGNEGITGVHSSANGEVIISANGSQGRLLHGTSAGLNEFGRYPIALIGMAPLGERLLFATGDGAAELIGRDVTMIKSNFSTATLSPGRGRVFFIEPAQPVPRYAEYDPRFPDAEWRRVKF